MEKVKSRAAFIVFKSVFYKFESNTSLIKKWKLFMLLPSGPTLRFFNLRSGLSSKLNSLFNFSYLKLFFIKRPTQNSETEENYDIAFPRVTESGTFVQRNLSDLIWI